MLLGDSGLAALSHVSGQQPASRTAKLTRPDEAQPETALAPPDHQIQRSTVS